MKIKIENLDFKCIIGVLDFERKNTQRVIVNITLKYNFTNNSYLDYSQIVTVVKKHMIDNKFTLLEEALESLSELLFDNFCTIKTLTLTISKPDILHDCTVSVTKKYIS